MNMRIFLTGALLLVGTLETFPAAASESIFSDIIVVTARRDLPQSIAVQADESTPFAADTAAMVAQLPGAALVGNGSLSGQIQYRGAYGFRVGTRINGQAFQSGGPNLMDPPMHYAPPTLVETIEVTRGAAPLSFGPSLVGGVETRLKQIPFGATGTYEGGYDLTLIGRSADSSHAVGLVGGLANQELRTYGYYSGERGSDQNYPGGSIDNTFHDRQVLGAGLGFRKAESTWELEVRRQESGATGNPPFAMDIEYVETDFARLGYETELAGTTLRVALGYSDVGHGMSNYASRPPPVSLMQYRRTIATAQTLSLKADLETTLASGDLEYGIDVELADHDVQIGNPNNPGFLVQPIPAAEQDRVGSYLNWRSTAGSGHYEIGLRLDHYQDQSGTTRTGPAVPAMPGMLAMAFNNGDRSWQYTTVDLLARFWQTNDLGTWRVSLARKNRAPTYLERFGWLPIAASAGLADGNNYLGDINLDVETAWIGEIGIDIAGGSWWLRPAVYYHQVKDYIQGVAFDSTPGIVDSAVEMVSMMNGDMTPLRFGNVDARMIGLDADYGWQFAGQWRLEGVVSVVRGERRDVDDDLYRIAPDRLTLALVYDRSSWSVQAEVVGVRRQSRVSATNSEQKTSGFSLVNVSAGWQLADGLRVSGGIENLLDREYEQHLAGYNRVSDSDVPVGSRLPGVGRNVFLRVSLHR